MKRFYLLLMGVMALNTALHAQILKGKVVDEKNAPLAYANVILQTEDSVFLTGTTTDLEGEFVIDRQEAKLINFSFVGYTTIVREINRNDLGVVQLLPDAQLLGEVVVKGFLPKTQVKGDAMATTVTGTVLEKAGTAENLLDKIPNVTVQDGEVTVFGRGTPEIYINGRKVRAQQELDQLASDQIKSVEVVSNPGARYDASVKAVIRIITKKVEGEGFGIDNRTEVRHRMRYGWSALDQLNINYRKNGVDLSGMLYGASFKDGYNQYHIIDTYLEKHWKQHLNLKEHKYNYKQIEAALSLNYQFDENHTMGVRYNLDRTPELLSLAPQLAQTYCGDELYESVQALNEGNEVSTSHRTNVYYSGRVGGWSIDFNADGLWNDSKTNELTQENVIEGLDKDADRTVTTEQIRRNELYAAKLVLAHPVAQGNLSFGAEYSHNKRNTSYLNAEGIIANDEALIKEGMTSAFVEYARLFNKVQMQAGVRYERVGFDYYNAGKHVSEQSKDYSNIFPSITFGFPIKDVQVQLGYASDITRPSYHRLRSNVTYVNRYMYQSGNPFLMPSISHNVTLASSYKWISLYMAYSHVMDEMTEYTVAYNDNDPTIGMLTIVNVPEYDKLVTALTLSPTIGFWTPQLTIAMQKQWYKGETPLGKKNFNAPIGNFSLRNSFKLPQGILLEISGNYQTKGYVNNIYLNEGVMDMSASLYKSFLKDNLTFQLNATNLLEPEQVATVYSGIRTLQPIQVFHRQITMTLRYKFNSTKSKYKGTGAGASQKNRM